MARLVGNNRDNRIDGTDDDDVILGLAGRDRLHGRGDSDRLDGGSGNDHLFGGDDSDVLIGGRGNDMLTGGSDGDRFVFGAGRDVITDFQANDDDDDGDDDDGGQDDDGDVIDLRGLAGIDSFADIRAAARQQGDDLVLRFDADTRLTLLDTRWAELDRDDFLI